MKIPDPKKHQNPDGTYNGVTYMAEMSGLSEAEIQWTWNRMKELRAEGRSKDEVRRIVRDEARSRPWLGEGA